MMALSSDILRILVGEMRTAKMTILVTCLFALRLIPT